MKGNQMLDRFDNFTKTEKSLLRFSLSSTINSLSQDIGSVDSERGLTDTQRYCTDLKAKLSLLYCELCEDYSNRMNPPLVKLGN